MEDSLLVRADRILSPVLGHYTRLEVERGEGCHLIGKNGKAYLDFASGIGVASTGHCHPDVVKAIQTQAAQLIHASIGVVYYDKPILLGEKLCEVLGAPFDSVFFCQSGTEAVEAAIKLAKYTTKKTKMLAFKGGFHGRSLGALSVTTSKMKYREGYEPLGETVFFPYPYPYRDTETQGPEALRAFFDTLQTDDIAAAIIEPIMGEGGYVRASDAFLRELRRLCTERGILLILDEIQSGFCKTGTWFAFQQTGIIPDIVVLAKGLGSGMPLGACVANRSLMEKWTTGAHGGTYGSNPVACAAGLATLSVLEKTLPTLSEKASKMADFLAQHIAPHPCVGEVRQWGMMVGIEFVTDKASKIPNPAFMKQIMATCLERQLILISCGIEDNVIRLIPPLVISTGELLRGLQILSEVLYAHH